MTIPEGDGHRVALIEPWGRFLGKQVHCGDDRDPDVDYEALVVQRNASRWFAKLGEFGILAVNWNNV